MNCFLHLLAALVLFPIQLFCQSQQFPSGKLDSFISKAMNDWHLLGLAVAIIKKDSVILAKGYGYRDYAKKLPVNENTVFPIASCSKTFTTALMGIAEQEGKIELNKPVYQYFPQFQMYTDELTKQVTAEDMLSHRTGSAGHDWAWTFNTNFPEDVYLKRIKYHEPFAPWRTKFKYSNFMFFALSVLSGKLYNTTWNDLVTKKIFQPLEMNNTYSSYRENYNTNTALKYEFNDSFRLKPTNQMDDLLGAGSVNSTAADLAKWLQVWINGGKYKSKQILPAAFIKKTLESRTVVNSSFSYQYPDEHFSNMGLCWFLSSYRGHYKANHTGNIDGYSSSISFFPTDSLGIVILTNQNGSLLINLVPDFVADLLFNLPVRDKNSAMLEKRKLFESNEKKSAVINIDTIGSRPFYSSEKYTGRFENAGYGEITIETFKNVLLLTYYNLKLVLIPKGEHGFSSHYFEDENISPDGAGDVVFKFDDKGTLQSFQIPLEPSVKDIIFQKL